MVNRRRGSLPGHRGPKESAGVVALLGSSGEKRNLGTNKTLHYAAQWERSRGLRVPILNR